MPALTVNEVARFKRDTHVNHSIQIIVMLRCTGECE